MKKSLFLIPGFRQRASDKCFVWLIKFLKEKGFVVVKVPVRWDRRLMADYVNDFERFYKDNKSQTNYILGFSWGAVIAFLSAPRLKPRKIYLCSLSPYFKEDVVGTKPWVQKIEGKQRIAEKRKFSGREIAKKFSIPSVVFYGEIEGRRYPLLKKRCEETVRLARNSRLVVVKNAPHKINHPEYVKAIKQIFI